MPSIEEITESLDVRIKELNVEVATLEATRKALLNGSSPSPAPRRTARRKQRSAPAGGKTVLLAGTAVKILADSDGLTSSALAKQANADPKQVLPLLKELESAGRVRRTGERRATRWHADTDEDKVVRRAAELAKRSKSQAT